MNIVNFRIFAPVVGCAHPSPPSLPGILDPPLNTPLDDSHIAIKDHPITWLPHHHRPHMATAIALLATSLSQLQQSIHNLSTRTGSTSVDSKLTMALARSICYKCNPWQPVCCYTPQHAKPISCFHEAEPPCQI